MASKACVNRLQKEYRALLKVCQRLCFALLPLMPGSMLCLLEEVGPKLTAAYFQRNRT